SRSALGQLIPVDAGGLRAPWRRDGDNPALAATMGRALKRAQEHLALALAGFVICATALLPLLAVIAGGPLSGLAPLASATPWMLLFRSFALAGAGASCALFFGVPLRLLLGRADL